MHRNYCLSVSEDTCPSCEPVSGGQSGLPGASWKEERCIFVSGS